MTDDIAAAFQASTSSLHQGSPGPGFDAPSPASGVNSSLGSGCSKNWKTHSEYSNIMVWDEEVSPSTSAPLTPCDSITMMRGQRSCHSSPAIMITLTVSTQ